MMVMGGATGWAAPSVSPTVLDAPENWFYTVALENDSLTRSGDKYYTNGLRFTAMNTTMRPPRWINPLLDVLPFFDGNKPFAVQYSIGQNMYTPRDVTRRVPNSADRPYAGYLYGALGVLEGDASVMNEMELSVGVVGPSSLGRQTQRLVHEGMGIAVPKGWDAQLHDEPTLSLSLERRWPTFWRQDLPGGSAVTLMPHVGATVGNVYDLAAVGGTLQWISDGHEVVDNPMRVRPSTPGSGYFTFTDKPVYNGVEGRAVGRNIFLDGNTFGSSPSVQKKNLVGDLQGGVGVTWGRYRLGYTMVYRTKEFYGQAKNVTFGGINLAVKY
jgi:hypothetical protein